MLRATRTYLLVTAVGAVLAAAALGPACVRSKSTECSWGHICPAGRVCDPVGLTCIHPSQEQLCRGRPDGEHCQPEHAPADDYFLCAAGICRRSVCGDGLRDTRPGMDEACDDGNTEAGDGCRADCLGLEHCPDGWLDEAAGEICDDGNLDNNDQCTIFCRRIECGDGLLSGVEACDDGTDLNSDTVADACRSDCVLPACEDDVVDSPDPAQCWRSNGEILVTTSPRRVLTADFNGDGLDDLLVWSSDFDRFEVHLSQGDGSWAPAPGSPHQMAFGIDLEHVTVGLVDDDPIVDVVVAIDPASGADPGLLIYLGDGTGDLTLHSTAGAPWRDLNFVALADVDGDGSSDLIAQYDPACELDVFLGNTDGSFGSATTSDLAPGHCWVTGMVAAQLDDDGDLDLVVATGEDGIFVLQGNGLGGLEVVPDALPTPNGSVRDLAVVDVNGDGRPDILYPEQRPPQTPLRVWLNQGGFELTAPPAPGLTLGLASLRFEVGDLNGDSIVDLVAVDFLAAVVFLAVGAGDGTFTVMVPPTEGMAMSADDLAFGRFTAQPFGGLALLKITERRVALWEFSP